MDGEDWTVLNAVEAGMPYTKFYCIAIDGDNTMWLGAAALHLGGGGLLSFDGSGWESYHVGNSGLPSDYVWALAIDRDGTKWIGTEFGGIASYTGNPGAIRTQDLSRGAQVNHGRIHCSPSTFGARTVIRFQARTETAESIPVLIRDLQGATVKRLDCRHSTHGLYTAVWCGDNDRAKPVPQGVYFCVISHDGTEETAALRVVR
jgi:hypothetical protein